MSEPIEAQLVFWSAPFAGGPTVHLLTVHLTPEDEWTHEMLLSEVRDLQSLLAVRGWGDGAEGLPAEDRMRTYVTRFGTMVIDLNRVDIVHAKTLAQMEASHQINMLMKDRVEVWEGRAPTGFQRRP